MKTQKEIKQKIEELKNVLGSLLEQKTKSMPEWYYDDLIKDISQIKTEISTLEWVTK